VDTKSRRRAIPPTDRRTGRVVPPREGQRSVERQTTSSRHVIEAGVGAGQAPAETGMGYIRVAIVLNGSRRDQAEA
jgi:hypothetical protein